MPPGRSRLRVFKCDPVVTTYSGTHLEIIAPNLSDECFKEARFFWLDIKVLRSNQINLLASASSVIACSEKLNLHWFFGPKSQTSLLMLSPTVKWRNFGPDGVD